jgi:hypothetical protein
MAFVGGRQCPDDPIEILHEPPKQLFLVRASFNAPGFHIGFSPGFLGRMTGRAD